MIPTRCASSSPDLWLPSPISPMPAYAPHCSSWHSQAGVALAQGQHLKISWCVRKKVSWERQTTRSPPPVPKSPNLSYPYLRITPSPPPSPSPPFTFRSNRNPTIRKHSQPQGWSPRKTNEGNSARSATDDVIYLPVYCLLSIVCLSIYLSISFKLFRDHTQPHSPNDSPPIQSTAARVACVSVLRTVVCFSKWWRWWKSS